MKNFFLSFLFVAIVASLSAQTSSVFVTDAGAIKGYDPVAFFLSGKAILGLKTYSYQWNNATWYFSSQANLDTFKSDPEKFAPQYGGYCAYGAAHGHKAPTETDTWSIVDGKLYFNYNKDVQAAWKKDQHQFIEKANETWPTIKDKP